MADQFEIKRAERKRARLRLAVCAASNGGKTWTGLELAFGLVEELISRGELSGTAEGKIGVIDTERQSAELYAHLGPFDTIQLGPPFSVDRYEAAIHQLERAGYAVIMVDSLSHAWAGAGGVLALLSTFQDKDRFSAFNSAVNPEQDRLVDAMLRSPCHVIATMRSKTAWVLEDVTRRDGSHGKAPKRVGLAPIQRPGIEFEFTTLLDLDTKTHYAEVVKNRCPVFDNWQPKKITREHGRALATWLLEGAPAPEAPLSGTPEERAEATASMAVRSLERCQNVPDMVRAYESALGQLKGFVGTVETERLLGLRQQVIDAKDARKAALGGDRAGRQVDTSPGDPPPPPPARPGLMEAALTDEESARVRELIREGGLRIADVLERYGVVRIESIARERFEEVCAWLQTQVNTLAQRAGKKVGAGGHFDDMKDDIPF